ncbi:MULTISPECIES: DUF559 domain-containing protein [unclassified Rathayibacter]|uniref:DUF559 domain-containing protein n=1 Tax=unclassified Rathayibacter TaxID=2609250 RepID=UPI0012E89899|nr:MULTISPECIES: DUF559 domain-containing protein [unclassified Rathayibacter]
MTAELPEGVFRVSEGYAAGATRAAMRAVVAPVRGVRTVRPAATLADRCSALLYRLGREAFVCGPTAALLWGAPLELRWERRGEIDVAVASPLRAPHAIGIAGRSLALDPSIDVLSYPLGRLTTPARTWCDLSVVLELPDLVAVGDHLLHRGICTAEALHDAVQRYRSRRGLRRLRQALGHLDARAESRPESLVRVALVLAGIQGIEANVEIYDAAVFLGRVDLCIARARVIVEYHGDYHRVERDRWRRDRARIGLLRAAGWFVIELTGDDLADLASVVAQVQTAIRR